MTEEMEKKLNELLGLKKQVEEMMEGKRNSAISETIEKYDKEIRAGVIRYYVGIAIGLAQYLVFVVLGMGTYNNDTLKFIFIGIGLVGLGVPMVAKLGLLIKIGKLSILKEMKQFELRITDLLKK